MGGAWIRSGWSYSITVYLHSVLVTVHHRSHSHHHRVPDVHRLQLHVHLETVVRLLQRDTEIKHCVQRHRDVCVCSLTALKDLAGAGNELVSSRYLSQEKFSASA